MRIFEIFCFVKNKYYKEFIGENRKFLGSQQITENNNNHSTTTTTQTSTGISVPTAASALTTTLLTSIKSINDRNSLLQQSNQMTMMTTNPSSIGNTTMHNSSTISQQEHQSSQQQQQQHSSVSGGSATIPTLPKPQLVFHCQLAHGSPTGLITGFASVKELYQKIAECYEFPTEEIIFCTLNTHKVDMTKLLGGQIGLDDFIFAHRKGRPKEIEIVKTEDALGLTITDNGAGYAFIKRIKEGSVIDKIPHIMVGDHIEKLNDVCVVGKRHFEVARLLKDIPTGATFTLRLIEPMKSGFQGIGPRSSGTKGSKKQSYGSGKETLRFKANGNAEIENIFDDVTQTGIDAINALLDSFMGINDSELATQIWDLGADKTNSMDFAEALDNSDLEAFGFTDDFIIELWGAITDARHGRLKK